MKNNLEVLKICLEETENAKDRIHAAYKAKDREVHLAESLCSLIRIETELKMFIEESEHEIFHKTVVPISMGMQL